MPTFTNATGYLKAAPARGVAEGLATYPVEDREGDFVRPDGGDWSAYPASPRVDWWHRVPIARGEQSMVGITDDDGKRWAVPLIKATFFERAADLRGIDRRKRSGAGEYTPDECLATADHVAGLVADDAVAGLSLEFDPAGPLGVAYHDRSRVAKARPVGRPPYTFDAWRPVAVAIAPESAHVNPGALLLLKALADPAERRRQERRWERCERIARDRTHAGKPLPHAILKAFDPYTTAARLVSARITPTRLKVMPFDEDEPLDVAPGTPEEPGEAPDMAAMDPPEDETPPEAAEAYDGAQMMTDLAEQLRARTKKTLHAKTRKVFAKWADALDKMAADCAAHGESVEGELSGAVPDDAPDEGDDDESDEPDSDIESDDEDDGDEKPSFGKAFYPLAKPVRKAADGAVILKSHYTPRRFKKTELTPAPAAQPAAEPDPNAAAELRREQKRLRKAVRSLKDLSGHSAR